MDDNLNFSNAEILSLETDMAISLEVNREHILRNGVIGDSCISFCKTNRSYYWRTNGIEYNLVKFKSDIMNSNVRKSKQYGWGTKQMYSSSKSLGKGFSPLGKDNVLNTLDLVDLFIWILDDGSYHKRKGFLNLNSQALSLEQNIKLTYRLWHGLSIESRILPDKKKDGRLFWYLYLPGAQVDSLIPEMKVFYRANHLSSVFKHKFKIDDINDHRKRLFQMA